MVKASSFLYLDENDSTFDIAAIGLQLKKTDLTYYMTTAFVVLVFTVIGQSFLAHNYYNDADHSYFVYGGLSLLKGQTLYLDFWDQKPPAIFYQNAMFYALFGEKLLPQAIVHGLVFCGSLFHFIFSLRHLLKPYQLCAFAILCAYGFNLNHYIDYGNRTEFGVAIFEMLSISYILRYLHEQKLRHLTTAGFCTAIAFLYKPIGMAPYLAFSAWLVICWLKKTAPTLKPWLCLSLGFVLPNALIALFLLKQGALDAALQAIFIAPLKFTGSGPNIVDAVWLSFKKLGPLWGIAWPLLTLPWILRESLKRQNPAESKLDQDTITLAFLWLGAVASGIILQRHGRPHYHHPAVIPTVLTAFLCFNYTTTKLQKTWINACAWALLIASTFTFAKYPMIQQLRWFQQLQQPQAQHEEAKRLATFLKQQLSPDEQFYYWSFGYGPHVTTQTLSSGRISPVFLMFGDHLAREISQDLEILKTSNHVKFLIETPHHGIFKPQEVSESTPDAHRAIQEFLSIKTQHYIEFKYPSTRFKIYKRKSD